jgi:peptidoglycan/xylan/chitin deacetylase (PgdA/CDA1 family)
MRVYRFGVWGVMVLFALLAGGVTTDALLAQNQVIKKVPTTQKVVALTFDDGPEAHTTPELLAVLREKQVHATMFVLGKNVEKNPRIFAQTVADGHEIASHGYSHEIFSRMRPAQYLQEITKVEQLLKDVAPQPVFFRPPGGGWNDSVAAALRQRGYTIVLWSVDPRDWARPSVQQVVQTVLQQVKPGSIIIMHDGQPQLPTPAAVGIIIDRLRAEGYKILTVGELLKYYEEQH